ncbi:MAG: choice-of-anchor J domain-containing protein [Candidatus Eisenbacteria bacterium]|nr:choice-of-anchor J domain-containing protein [Candidatus Eisenbacteria bacterium]
MSILPILIVLLLAGAATTAHADVLEQEIRFDRDALTIYGDGEYDRVVLRGTSLPFDPGAPELPVSPFHLALPGGAVVESVELTGAEWTLIPGRYTVRPTQPPAVLSYEELGIDPPERAEPRQEIYASSEPWPAEPILFSGDGYMAGVHIAGFQIFPVRFRPDAGSIELCERATVRVVYRIENDGRRYEPAGDRIERPMGRVVTELVANPRDLDGMDLRAIEPSLRLRDGESYDYLLICPIAHAPYYEPLVEWKTRKGLKVRLMDRDEIDSLYAGIEEASARIRQAIIDAYANWGITYVLLGGDPDRIASRDTWAMDSGQLGGYNYIHADLYYSDLDGDWNANVNARYGQVEDNVDLYPDVIVGRFCARNTAQVEAMVAKQLTYERTPPVDYQTDMLFTGEVLWSDPLTDSRVSLDAIDEEFVPSRFDPIQKLYETLGNENRTTVLNAINSGKNFWLHDGHGHYDVMSVGGGTLYGDSMKDLHNGPRFSICYSVACLAAGFQQEAIAEWYVRNADGGGVAFIGNNSFGWGSPGNPKFGYSDRLQHRFFKQLFLDGMLGVGQNLAAVKAYYVPQSRTENVYRWHQYSVNLLGEPEFAAWTDIPDELDVEHPADMPLAPGLFTVTVTTGGSPMEGATVCVTDDGDVHVTGVTGAGGQAVLAVTPLTADTLHVTVTAHDHLPYEGTAAVFPSGPYASLTGAAIDDASGGNDNGLPNAGETIDLTLTLANPGTDAATGVTGTLRSDDPWVVVTDSVASFGDLPAGGSAGNASPFVFTLATGAPAGHSCRFDLTIASTSGGPWSGVYSLVVAAPRIRFAELGVDDQTGGDGDGRAEPGESLTLTARFHNYGDDLSEGMIATARSSSSWLVFTDPIASAADIAGGAEANALFDVNIPAGCPDPHFVLVRFDIADGNGYAFAESTLVAIGETGFADDLESGGVDWTHGGSNDLWHLSPNRTHSGNASWYAGRQDTSVYDPGMNAWLDAPSIALDPDPSLSFWLWHEVATYGSDGLYVILTKDAVHDTIDWIASGGALAPLVIGNDWMEFHYDLSFRGYEAGDEVQLTFAVKTDDDEDIAEGFYIDDVVITGTLAVATGVEMAAGAPRVTELRGASPNPFNPTTTLHFSTAAAGPVRLAVYDVQGRLVRTLVDRALPAGAHETVWDGRNGAGTPVASGIYLTRLDAAGEARSSKVVLLR